jgi:hypothetical protein
MTASFAKVLFMLALGAAMTASPASAKAQAAPLSPEVPPSVGVLLVAHGGSDGGDRGFALAVGRGGRIKGPVGVSFLMGAGASAHRFQDVVDTLAKAGARRLVVVPVLVSSHSGHYEQIRYLAGNTETLDSAMMHHLHMSGIARSAAGIPLTVVPALDDAPELAQVVSARALALTPAPSGRALFLLVTAPTRRKLRGVDAESANRRRLRAHRSSFASVVVELVRRCASVFERSSQQLAK